MNDLSTIRVEAQVLRCGYALDYFSKSQIEGWADGWIAHLDHPSMDLIELATIRNVHQIEVLKMLKAIGGETEPSQFVATSLGIWGRMYLDEKVSLAQAIRGIYNLVHEQGITEEQKYMIYHLDDAFDLAVDGRWGSIDETVATLRDFLTPYANHLTEQTGRFISEN